MLKKIFAFLFIIFAVNGTLFAKLTLSGGRGGHGHADDIARLLTGRDYVSSYENPDLNIMETGLAYLMHLVVDSRIKKNGEILPEGENAMQYLKDHQDKLKISNVPNLREIVTPGGNGHGVYSHLGWNHVYTEEPIPLGLGEVVYVNRAWILRKKLLCDALGKIFDFGLFEGKKKDALGALLYYVHILGDHEENEASTANTRIPIISMDEQGAIDWGSNQDWIPRTTIKEELLIYLPILFSDQKNTHSYSTMIKQIEEFNVFSVIHINKVIGKVSHFTDSEAQTERAKYLLQILSDFCPYLLSQESFAKKFYQKYNIK